MIKWLKKLFEEKPRCFWCNRTGKKLVQVALSITKYKDSRVGGYTTLENHLVCEDQMDCWNNS